MGRDNHTAEARVPLYVLHHESHHAVIHVTGCLKAGVDRVCDVMGTSEIINNIPSICESDTYDLEKFNGSVHDLMRALFSSPQNGQGALIT